VIDLSLARPPGPAPAGVGTWCYLAPEQARGGALGAAADVWGIGVVLFEAATGAPAFDDPGDPLDDESLTASSEDDSGEALATWASDDRGEEHYPQLEGRAVPVGSLRQLPPSLAHLIDASLSPDPDERPLLPELLAGLELLAKLPASERRWTDGVGLSAQSGKVI
jgi:serine/threonine protein kinase